MKTFLCVAVQLMLSINAMAFVSLEGCERGPISVHKAKEALYLRQEIKEKLGFDMEDPDIIAGFYVHDEGFEEAAAVYFAGRQKDGKAVTFMSNEHHENLQWDRIDYSLYYLYLQCKLATDEEDEGDTENKK